MKINIQCMNIMPGEKESEMSEYKREWREDFRNTRDAMLGRNIDADKKLMSEIEGVSMRHGVFSIYDYKELKTDALDGEYPILADQYYSDESFKTTELVKVKNGFIDPISLMKATDEWMVIANQTIEVSDHIFLEASEFCKETKTINIIFGS